MSGTRSALASFLLALAWLASPGIGHAQGGARSPEDSLQAAEILEELIEIPSVSGTPETVQAARAMASRLEAAGFPQDDVHVLEPLPDVGMLVARYPGTGERPPILLLAHIDVVPALQAEIRSLAPEELVIVCSPQSRKNAERAAEAMAAGPDHVSILELSSPHDLDAAFSAVNGAIDGIASRVQRAAKLFCELTFVFDDKNAHQQSAISNQQSAIRR